MMPIDDLDAADPRLTTEAATLLAQSLPAEAVGLVPYGLPGYHRYLAALLAPPPGLRTVWIRTILRGGTPIALADWRMLRTTLFLNGLAVHADFRGGGLGRRLVDDGVAFARAMGAARLALDVATGNAAATALYRRAGFTAGVELPWHYVAVGGSEPRQPNARVVDWPTFSAGLAAYGFADLSVRGSDGEVASARVIGKVLRVNTSAGTAGLAPAELCALTGCTQAYAVGGPAEHPFLRFVRQTRCV
ncbi:MAG TPA: GNAT family N-acetyltransferase [Actinoplanes sp.]|jgi:GNAT superfamily N-acetyltransferase